MAAAAAPAQEMCSATRPLCIKDGISRGDLEKDINSWVNGKNMQISNGEAGAAANHFARQTLGVTGMAETGSCRRMGVANATTICDDQSMKEFPTEGIPDKLSLLVINGTSVSRLPSRAFEGKFVFALVLQDNYWLSDIDVDAFEGSHGMVYLRANRNHLRTSRSWKANFFAPFMPLRTLRFLILDSNDLNVMDMPTGEQEAALPCLEYLSLRSNPLTRISGEFFKPLACSPLSELSLHATELQSIHEDAFTHLPFLQKLSLYNNFKLFQFVHSTLPPAMSLVPFDGQHLAELDLSANLMAAVPYTVLSQVNATMVKLKLSNNVLVELGVESIKGYMGRWTFPEMRQLTDLELVDCRIQKIHEDTFINLPNLRRLDLSKNLLFTITEAVATLPSLEELNYYGMKEMFYSGDRFKIPEGIFRRMPSLKRLSLKHIVFGALRAARTDGLQQLEELYLDGSDLSLMENDAFQPMRSLKSLSLAHAECLDFFPMALLIGLDNLEHLDLTGVQLFASPMTDDSYFHYLMAIREAPMHSLRSMNLSGSLDGSEHAVDLLRLSSLTSLEELNLSRNRIVSWSTRRFAENHQLKYVSIAANEDYINLTEAMVEDFQNLTTLDLTGNDFLCNDGVISFHGMANDDNSPEVIGWSFGYGYQCKDRHSGKRKTFSDYATGGLDLSDPFTPATNVQTTIEGEQPNYGLIGGAILACIVLIPVLAVLANVAYNNRW